MVIKQAHQSPSSIYDDPFEVECEVISSSACLSTVHQSQEVAVSTNRTLYTRIVNFVREKIVTRE